MADTADFNDIPKPGAFLLSYANRFAGALVISVSIAVCVALASWNVEDPSLTHATDAELTNLLGFPGSAISDLMFQFFGLTSIALTLLPMIWGWQMLRSYRSVINLKRVSLYLASTPFLCGVTACLSVPLSWPLPTGLGGIVGGLILAIPAYFLGELTGLTYVVIGMVLTIPLPFLLKRAFHTPRSDDEVKPGKKRRPKIGNQSNDEFGTAEPGFSSILMGALTHLAFSTTTKIRHLLKNKREKIRRESVPQHDLTMEKASSKGRLAMSFATLKSLKRKLIDEPVANDGLGDYLEKAAEPDEDIDDPILTSRALELIPQGIASPEHRSTLGTPTSSTIRVAQPAPKDKPSQRKLSEAQLKLPDFKDPEKFELPPLHLLTEAPTSSENHGLSSDALAQNAEILEGVLEDFGVKGEIIHVRPGPVVTLYELEPAPGIKSSRVIGLADDIARSMSAIATRVAVIPGKNAIGIELPNAKRETVYLHESLASKTFENNKGKLPICLGKTIGGESVIADLARMPHLLVAGTTGSGKSVAINTMILSLLFRMTPEQCKLIMIDPKMLELSVYDGIPHLLTPVVTDPKKAVVALKWTVREMEDRYRNMSKVGVRNIDGFNTRVRQAAENEEPIIRTIQTGYDAETGEAIYEREELDLSPLPFIVVIIDEMADLMMVAGKDIEGAIQRLAQMARAAGIHVIMATQRPSVDVITGTIKANFPTRISFQVTSKIDSRTILGEQGAEQLLGMGDMLYMAGGGRIQRVHGPFVDDKEVEDVVQHLKEQGIPQYLGAVTEETEDHVDFGNDSSSGNVSDSADPYDQAVAIVLRDKKASTSYIQRRLGIGYNRAASIIERMEEEGVVGPANHAGKREILVGSDPEEDFDYAQ